MSSDYILREFVAPVNVLYVIYDLVTLYDFEEIFSNSI